MEDETAEAHIQQAEQDLFTYYDRFGRSQSYWKAYEIYKANNDLKNCEIMTWEIWASSLELLSKHHEMKIEGFPSQTFGAMKIGIKDNGEAIYNSNPLDFTEETYTYYGKRMKETKNPFLRARYADILWDQKNHKLNRFEAAKTAIISYIETAETWVKEIDKERKGYSPEFSPILGRTFTISIQLQNDDLIKNTILQLYVFVGQLFRMQRPWDVAEILESMLDFVRISGFIEFDKINLIVESIKTQQKEEIEIQIKSGKTPNFNILKRFIDIQIMCTRKYNKSESEIKSRIYEYGNTIMKEAEERLKDKPSKSNNVAAYFYQQAFEYFSSNGISEKNDELKLKIKECLKEAEKSEYQRYENKFTIKTEDIDKIIEPCSKLNPQQIFLTIIYYMGLCPSYNRSYEQAKKDLNTYITLQFNSTIIRDANPSVAIAGEDARLKARTNTIFVHDYNMTAVFFGLILKRLIEKGLIKMEDLTNMLYAADLLNHDKQFIAVAMDRYIVKDYVSFLSIAVPRIENVLRRIFEIFNLPTTSAIIGKGFKELTLDTLLEEEKLKEVLGEEFIYFLKYFLVEKEGTNLRHDIAHGLVKFESLGEIYSDLVLYILLVFATFKVIKKEQ